MQGARHVGVVGPQTLLPNRECSAVALLGLLRPPRRVCASPELVQRARYGGVVAPQLSLLESKRTPKEVLGLLVLIKKKKKVPARAHANKKEEEAEENRSVSRFYRFLNRKSIIALKMLKSKIVCARPFHSLCAPCTMHPPQHGNKIRMGISFRFLPLIERQSENIAYSSRGCVYPRVI